MGLDSADVERLLKLGALITQAIQEFTNILANKEAQKGRTEDENFAHAEERNKEARKLIEAL